MTQTRSSASSAGSMMPLLADPVLPLPVLPTKAMWCSSADRGIGFFMRDPDLVTVRIAGAGREGLGCLWLDRQNRSERFQGLGTGSNPAAPTKSPVESPSL